jgi:small-conductance mechanosensitive channel
LLSLFRNAATIAIIIITLMFSLSEIGINIGPLLASAGVLGLA